MLLWLTWHDCVSVYYRYYIECIWVLRWLLTTWQECVLGYYALSRCWLQSPCEYHSRLRKRVSESLKWPVLSSSGKTRAKLVSCLVRGRLELVKDTVHGKCEARHNLFPTSFFSPGSGCLLAPLSFVWSDQIYRTYMVQGQWMGRVFSLGGNGHISWGIILSFNFSHSHPFWC